MEHCDKCNIKTKSIEPNIYETNNNVILETKCSKCKKRRFKIVKNEKQLDELVSDKSDSESESEEEVWLSESD